MGDIFELFHQTVILRRNTDVVDAAKINQVSHYRWNDKNSDGIQPQLLYNKAASSVSENVRQLSAHAISNGIVQTRNQSLTCQHIAAVSL